MSVLINPYRLGSAAPTSISQQSSATSTNSATITAPSGIQAGDLLVLLDSVWNNFAAPPASSVPTGFTSIVTATLGAAFSARMTLSYKKADGTESSASLTGMTGSGGAAKVLYTFRGNTPINDVNVSATGSEATDGNPVAQTISASGGTPPLVAIAGYSSSAAVDPRTFTVGGVGAKDGELEAAGTSIFTWLAYKLYNASPANISVDMDDEGSSNIILSVYLSCT